MARPPRTSCVGAIAFCVTLPKNVEGLVSVARPRPSVPFVARPMKSNLFMSAASVEDSSLAPGIDSINNMNGGLDTMLHDLREQDFFRLYSCDMLASCEYMPQELFECYTESCEIYPVDDDEIPEAIKSVDYDEHDFEIDGWARWDMPTEDYYDLKQFPEEFTGYDGSEVWRFIHERICFCNEDTSGACDISADADYYDADSWKADFNKAVSGLHAMISAQIIRGIEDKINRNEPLDEGTPWTDPRAEFHRRLGTNGETPRAMENLYFGYMLVLTAVSKARDRLLHDCDSGNIDPGAASALRPVLSYPLLDDPSIAVASKKLLDHALREDGSLWEARMRTRELMRIMNCVQCNKCRLHGKISVLGLSTALQVLLGRSGEGADFTRVHRVELAALMTTLSKFSTAIAYCQKMTNS